MEQDEKNRLARLGYCVAASCVIPDMFQGWSGLDPMTGSFETEDEAWDGLAKSVRRATSVDDDRDLTPAEAKLIADTMMGRRQPDSLGLMHDRVHKDVGRSRIARTARRSGPKCSCTPGGGYGCACPGCEGAEKETDD